MPPKLILLDELSNIKVNLVCPLEPETLMMPPGHFFTEVKVAFAGSIRRSLSSNSCLSPSSNVPLKKGWMPVTPLSANARNSSFEKSKTLDVSDLPSACGADLVGETQWFPENPAKAEYTAMRTTKSKAAETRIFLCTISVPGRNSPFGRVLQSSGAPRSPFFCFSSTLLCGCLDCFSC